jgi:hypothetical protein
MAAPNTILRADFEGAASEPPPGWITGSGLNTTASLRQNGSGFLTKGTTGYRGCATFNTAFREDQEAWVEIDTPAADDWSIEVRIQNPASASGRAYVLLCDVLTPGNYFLQRYAAGGFGANLATLTTGPTQQAGDIFLLRAVGSTITAYHYRAGVETLLFNVTDTNIVGAGRIGMNVGTVGVGTPFRNFGGGSVTVLMPIAASVSLGASLGSKKFRTLTAGATLTAALANVGIHPRVIAANLSLTAALTWKAIRPRLISAGLTVAPVFVLTKGRALTGSLTLTPTQVRIAKHFLALSATVTNTPALVWVAKHLRALVSTVTLTPVINRRLGKLLAAGLVAGQTITFAKSKFLTLAVTVTNTILMSRVGKYYKALAAGVTVAPTLIRLKIAPRTLPATATLAAQTQLVRIGRITLNPNLPLTIIVAKRGNKTLNSVVSLAGSVAAQKVQADAIPITLAAGLQLQVAVVKAKFIKKSISTALFLDTKLKRDKFMPEDNADDWLIDAKSMDTPQLDSAQLDEAVLEGTVL